MQSISKRIRTRLSSLVYQDEYFTMEPDPEQGNTENETKVVANAVIYSEMITVRHNGVIGNKSQFNESKNEMSTTTSARTQTRQMQYNQDDTLSISKSCNCWVHPAIDITNRNQTGSTHTRDSEAECEETIAITDNNKPHHPPQIQPLSYERSSLLSNPLTETEPAECDQSILSEAITLSSRVEQIILNVRQQNVNTDHKSENESERCIQPIDGNDSEQERFVKSMQAVGGNHYYGLDAMRDQTSGKIYC